MDRLACDRMLVAVIERGSLSGAAQKLGVSSGQASKLVSRLEEELGVQLLHRTTRSVSPTEVGRAYFERIGHGEAEGSWESGSLLEASDVANVITFMLTRPRGMTIRDVVMMPTNYDL